MAEYHSQIAVFCTAEIPTKTIEVFLERIREYQQSWFPSPRIITEGDLLEPSAITTASTSPPSSFTSPFLGKTILELNAIFTKDFASRDAFLSRAFIVLDKRTTAEDIEWASCQLVRGGEGFDEKNKNSLVRVDFYLSMQLASAMEQGKLDLDEGLHDPEKVMGVHNMSNY